MTGRPSNQKLTAAAHLVVKYAGASRYGPKTAAKARSELQAIAGPPCADAGGTLIDVLRRSKLVVTVAEVECQLKILLTPETPWQVKPLLATAGLMTLLIVCLLVAAIAGYEVPRTSQYLIAFLAAIFCAVMFFLAEGFAELSGLLPVGKAAQLTFKLGGTTAAFLITFWLMNQHILPPFAETVEPPAVRANGGTSQEDPQLLPTETVEGGEAGQVRRLELPLPSANGEGEAR